MTGANVVTKTRAEDLDRIERALVAAGEVLRRYTAGDVAWVEKSDRGDELTEADEAVDRTLRELLPRDGEGWLSEETLDDPARLACRRVWVVDPLDGTREFVQGIPEWCVSVGLVVDGRAVAGGIYSPSADHLILGSLETGVTLNGMPAGLSDRDTLKGARVLASRSEVGRGEWERFSDAPFDVVPCGSVAYKLGLVAAGMADATWTLVPKSEWDVAAGLALIEAAGGVCLHADGSRPSFNRAEPKLPNLLGARAALLDELMEGWLVATRK
jgi:myo-inositol-1(or 4)-monophosphatase